MSKLSAKLVSSFEQQNSFEQQYFLSNNCSISLIKLNGRQPQFFSLNVKTLLREIL